MIIYRITLEAWQKMRFQMIRKKREKPGKNATEVWVWRDCDVTDRSQWPEWHEWTRQKLEAFDQVFRPRIRALDAAAWNDEEAEEA